MSLQLKLYVVKRGSKDKLHLTAVAPTRAELAIQLGSPVLDIAGERYSVKEVFAEKSTDNTSLGMLVGGFIGALAGGVGIAAGGAVGAILGKEKDKEEQALVEQFNKSDVPLIGQLFL